jgi:hypothetical protein
MYKWSEIEKVVNLKDRKELDVLLTDWEHTLDYMDNIRIARNNNIIELYAYDLKKAKGCCGRRDIVYTCQTGTQYLVGCNYGH